MKKIPPIRIVEVTCFDGSVRYEPQVKKLFWWKPIVMLDGFGRLFADGALGIWMFNDSKGSVYSSDKKNAETWIQEYIRRINEINAKTVVNRKVIKFP